MEITDIRHDWPEKAGFTLVRPTGIEIYTFLHFMNSVEIKLTGKGHSKTRRVYFLCAG